MPFLATVGSLSNRSQTFSAFDLSIPRTKWWFTTVMTVFRQTGFQIFQRFCLFFKLPGEVRHLFAHGGKQLHNGGLPTYEGLVYFSLVRHLNIHGVMLKYSARFCNYQMSIFRQFVSNENFSNENWRDILTFYFFGKSIKNITPFLRGLSSYYLER
jgi:hypothetical protein